MKSKILFLKPVIKEKIWGSESWGVSAYRDADCIIDGGEYDGRTLSDLWKNVPELFGHADYQEFPLLTKIIDAKDDLSIQVHPDNEYARKYENSLGKKECWYILECPDNASLIIGNNAKDHEELEDMINNGRWSELCNEVPVRKGDFIQINPGTLHSIKGGFVILESQQSSDITYRVYDFDRVTDGKKRELHLKQSLDVIKTPGKYRECDIIHTTDVYDEKQLLESNDCYKVWKMHITKVADLSHDEPFLICTVADGEGTAYGKNMKKGDSFIIPCGIKNVPATGNMLLIMSAL